VVSSDRGTKIECRGMQRFLNAVEKLNRMDRRSEVVVFVVDDFSGFWLRGRHSNETYSRHEYDTTYRVSQTRLVLLGQYEYEFGYFRKHKLA
jgi:hypothetical protein